MLIVFLMAVTPGRGCPGDNMVSPDIVPQSKLPPFRLATQTPES
ncbi:hypothetical protein ACJCYG_004703 [Enterobacter ludwigii]